MSQHLQLDQSLLLHRLNKHLKQIRIPTIQTFPDITPSIFILLFEQLLNIKIPYVKRENIEIKDYMHNLKCLKAYLLEMGLKWIRERVKDIDLWDLIDVGTDEMSLKAIATMLDLYDDLKNWIEKEESKKSLHKSYDDLLKGKEEILDSSSSLESDSSSEILKKEKKSPLQSSLNRNKKRVSYSIDNDNQYLHENNAGKFRDTHTKSRSYNANTREEIFDESSSDDGESEYMTRFTKLTTEKKWKEAASLLRELEDRTQKLKKKTNKIIDLEATNRTLNSSINQSYRQERKSNKDSSLFQKQEIEHNKKSNRFGFLDELSFQEDSSPKYEDFSGEIDNVERKRQVSSNRKNLLSESKTSQMKSLLNHSSIHRDPDLSLSLKSQIRSPHETSRLAQLNLDQTLGTEEELNEKMQSILNTRNSLKSEKQVLEDERRLYKVLNTKPPSKRKSLSSKRSSLAPRIKSSIVNFKGKKSDMTFNEFRRLYEIYLDAFLNGESNVKPSLAVRNFLRDRKIEEIRLKREREQMEYRINRLESQHQREKEKMIDALMKKVEKTEKEKQRFEKSMEKEVIQEISQKKEEKQQVLESYYNTQIGLLQDLMNKTQSDDILHKKVKKWARELLDRSRELSKTSKRLSKSFSS